MGFLIFPGIPQTFPRMPYKEAMERYGSDKPDPRFEMELLDLTEILRSTQMNVFNNVIENGGIGTIKNMKII